MTDLDALTAACLDDPDGEGRLAVLSDWLEERGDARADAVRRVLRWRALVSAARPEEVPDDGEDYAALLRNTAEALGPAAARLWACACLRGGTIREPTWATRPPWRWPRRATCAGWNSSGWTGCPSPSRPFPRCGGPSARTQPTHKPPVGVVRQERSNGPPRVRTGPGSSATVKTWKAGGSVERLAR
jgi:hypothetical protein